MYFTLLEHKKIKQASPPTKAEEEEEILSKEVEPQEAKEEGEARPPSFSARANDENKDREENSGAKNVLKMFSEKVRAQSIKSLVALISHNTVRKSS